MTENPTWLCVVAAAMQGRDGRWLMHRRPPEKHHGGLWEFPGGKVEFGETPRSALVREIAEELGVALDPNLIAPIAFAEDPPSEDRRGLVILLYTVEEWRGDPVAMDLGAEVGWFTPTQIVDLELPPLDRALYAQIFGNVRGRMRVG